MGTVAGARGYVQSNGVVSSHVLGAGCVVFMGLSLIEGLRPGPMLLGVDTPAGVDAGPGGAVFCPRAVGVVACTLRAGTSAVSLIGSTC
jgi:hypothetical protein